MADGRRIDTASRIVPAPPAAVYRAMLDPDTLVSWLPPEGMTGTVHTYDARPGGAFHMTLTYGRPDHAAPGKTSDDADVAEGRFVELVPDRRVVWLVTFRSDDPAFAGEMTMAWDFVAVPDGTRVTISCENVPKGIGPEDHQAGLSSTLDNLARFLA